jgi:hypothetical protein
MLGILIDVLSAVGALSIMAGSFSILVFKLGETRYEKLLKKQLKSKQLNVANGENEKLCVDGENGQVTSPGEDQRKQTQKQSSSLKMHILKIIFFKV